MIENYKNKIKELVRTVNEFPCVSMEIYNNLFQIFEIKSADDFNEFVKEYDYKADPLHLKVNDGNYRYSDGIQCLTEDVIEQNKEDLIKIRIAKYHIDTIRAIMSKEDLLKMYSTALDNISNKSNIDKQILAQYLSIFRTPILRAVKEAIQSGYMAIFNLTESENRDYLYNLISAIGEEEFSSNIWDIVDYLKNNSTVDEFKRAMGLINSDVGCYNLFKTYSEVSDIKDLKQSILNSNLTDEDKSAIYSTSKNKTSVKDIVTKLMTYFNNINSFDKDKIDSLLSLSIIGNTKIKDKKHPVEKYSTVFDALMQLIKMKRHSWYYGSEFGEYNYLNVVEILKEKYSKYLYSPYFINEVIINQSFGSDRSSDLKDNCKLFIKCLYIDHPEVIQKIIENYVEELYKDPDQRLFKNDMYAQKMTWGSFARVLLTIKKLTSSNIDILNSLVNVPGYTGDSMTQELLVLYSLIKDEQFTKDIPSSLREYSYSYRYTDRLFSGSNVYGNLISLLSFQSPHCGINEYRDENNKSVKCLNGLGFALFNYNIVFEYLKDKDNAIKLLKEMTGFYSEYKDDDYDRYNDVINTAFTYIFTSCYEKISSDTNLTKVATDKLKNFATELANNSKLAIYSSKDGVRYAKLKQIENLLCLKNAFNKNLSVNMPISNEYGLRLMPQSDSFSREDDYESFDKLLKNNSDFIKENKVLFNLDLPELDAFDREIAVNDMVEALHSDFQSYYKIKRDGTGYTEIANWQKEHLYNGTTRDDIFESMMSFARTYTEFIEDSIDRKASKICSLV